MIMEKRFEITPAQRKIVNEKMEVLERYAKNIDFDNLPKRENHSKGATPTNEERLVQKKLDEANTVLRRMDVSVFKNKIDLQQRNEKQ
jgi:ribosome-associated translation inhibitor RaiA